MNPFYKPYVPKDVTKSATLLPAVDLEPKDDSTIIKPSSLDLTKDIEESSLSKSALHTGNFTNNLLTSDPFPSTFLDDLDRIDRSEIDGIAASSSSSWYRSLPFQSKDALPASPSIDIPNAKRTPTRSRAPSLQSLSPRYVMRFPTSPLARQSKNTDLDLSPIDLAASPTKSSRRHTLPPHSFQAFRTASQPMTFAQAARQPPSLQREHPIPFQTHHNRRSYTGLPFPSSPSPSTPSYLRSRRSSFASDVSPIQASMVGSYEESILRGRMSTTPSKPLNFTAQIGALGRGDCKPKYPAHVSVDFPAVYYSWNMSNGGSITDEPSPYVGHIDLEHKLNGPVSRDRPRKRRELQTEESDLNESSVKSRAAKRMENRRRRSQSPPHSLQSFGGCYRIPQQGQLQILIKNPYKTVVKLFLIPYDLEGMQPGTKTFVRQRSCSTGPIIEKPLTSRSFSDSITETKQKASNVKPVLRYLIQFNICCPAKDRFYLYKSIHVVFANRVPDDKEKLQNETLWPEPRYSPWKASTTDSGTSTPMGRQSFDGETRRRSYGGLHHNTSDIDIMDGIPAYSQIPSNTDNLQLFSMNQTQEGSTVNPSSMLVFPDINPDAYTKLSPDKFLYARRSDTLEPTESLLARRLRRFSDDKDDDRDFLGVGDMEME